MNNCLVILYAPHETGAPEPITRVRKYANEAEALWAFAETPCYWSELCEESQANVIAALAEERFKEGLLDEETFI
jgi:hypothetical protein